MKKIITLFLSVLLGLFSFSFAACTQYYKTPGGVVGSESSGAIDSTEEKPNGDPFTVQLRTLDGSPLPSLDGIYAIWTEAKEGAHVHQAYFNSDGLAASYKPDGDYEVTLSAPPVGYTYNPNVHTANNDGRNRAIDLYPLRGLTGGDGSAYNAFQARTTGAYRFVFEKPTDEFYFIYGSANDGEITFESLLDTTANEVTPVLGECWNTTNAGIRRTIKGGGAEGTYTKNFKYVRSLSDSQGMLFRIGVETINKKAFPIAIDMLLQKTGEYGEYIPPVVTAVEATMLKLPTDFPDNTPVVMWQGSEENWKAATPTGTFAPFALKNNRQLTQEMVVEHNGYYYYNKNYGVAGAAAEADLTRPVYACLTNNIPTVYDSEVLSGFIGYRDYVCPEAENLKDPKKPGLDYANFFGAYQEKVNGDGCYPVTTELKKFLYDMCVANQLFFDGLGMCDYKVEEGVEYGCKTSGESRWLFVCGLYE